MSAHPCLCYTASIMHRSLWAFSGERIKDPCFGPCSKVSRRCGVCNIHHPSLIVRLGFSFWWLHFSTAIYRAKVPGVHHRQIFESHAEYLNQINYLTSILERCYQAKHGKLYHPLGRPLRAAAPCLPPGLLGLFLMVMAAGAASCQLTPDSLVISSGWWMMEMPLAPLQWQKNAPISAPHLTVLFTLLSSHFHQLLKNSTHHIGSAADAEAKNETCVAGHRCSTWEFVQLAQSFLSGHHLTLLWLYHWVIHKDKTYVWLNASCFLWEHKQRYIVDFCLPILAFRHLINQMMTTNQCHLSPNKEGSSKSNFWFYRPFLCSCRELLKTVCKTWNRT